MSKNENNMEGKDVKENEVVETTDVSTTSNSENKPTKLTNEELATLDYADFSTPARMLALGSVLAKSSLVPLKKPEDVVVALMTGKELGLPFVTSVSQIYPINGRPTLGIHIQKALCLKNGIIFEKVEDAVDIFNFAQKDEHGKVVLKTIKTEQGDKKVPVIVKTGTMEERPDNTAFSKVTVRTKYKVTRYIKVPTGEYKELVAYGSFTLQEAQEAGLLEKDVWQKYWRRMLDARALSNAIKEIASDITLGLHTAEELSHGTVYNNEETGTIVDTSFEEVK